MSISGKNFRRLLRALWLQDGQDDLTKLYEKIAPLGADNVHHVVLVSVDHETYKNVVENVFKEEE